MKWMRFSFLFIYFFTNAIPVAILLDQICEDRNAPQVSQSQIQANLNFWSVITFPNSLELQGQSNGKEGRTKVVRAMVFADPQLQFCQSLLLPGNGWALCPALIIWFSILLPSQIHSCYQHSDGYELEKESHLNVGCPTL